MRKEYERPELLVYEDLEDLTAGIGISDPT